MKPSWGLLAALGLVVSLYASAIGAQSRIVRPSELRLEVEIEEHRHVPLAHEMVIITIRGLYRRHITREELVQPDFAGFSWSQLGPDKWTEERIDGEKVKIFERRMAIYPNRPGRLTIGAFTHRLTLTDEGDDWFDHEISSRPLTIEIAPAPATEGWWFPLRRLRVSDQWSNAPDQLKPGEGVLRVVRLEALGATPEMIPPMPELHSPSAMIFPHPEKRLVELSPEGPITYAFWRWTIRPSNDISAIVEPFRIEYFDTVARQNRTVFVSAKRVAYGSAIPDTRRAADAPDARPARLPGLPEASAALLVFLGGIGYVLWGRRMMPWRILPRARPFDRLAIRMRRAARRGDAIAVRRAAAAMIARDGFRNMPCRMDAMNAMDEAIFAPGDAAPDLRPLVHKFLQRSP